MKGELVHVVIPAYNEEDSVGSVVEGLKRSGMNLRIIVIDDGSRDGTADRARAAGALVARHPLNLGQWGALRTGFRLALMDGAEVVVTLDGDGQHAPEEIEGLVQPIIRGEADFVVGSRFISGDSPRMPIHRFYGIKFFNFIMKLRTGLNLTDCTCGFKAYRASVVNYMVPRLGENQYGALESIIGVAGKGYRLIEVPVKSLPSLKSSKGRLRYGVNLLRTILK